MIGAQSSSDHIDRILQRSSDLAPCDEDSDDGGRESEIVKELSMTKDEIETQATIVKPHWLVSNVVFQVVVVALILANAVAMGLEADYPQWHMVWGISEHIFTAAFLVEMILKLWALRTAYFKDAGNILDCVLVLVSIIDAWIVTSIGLDVDMQSLSILRVLRLARLFRVLRIFRMLRRFVLILGAIVDAVRTTMWIGLMLLICSYVAAIFTTNFIGRADQSVYPGYTDVEEDIDESSMMQSFNPYVSFGTIARSMMTLFNMVILTEWPEVARPILLKQPLILPVLMLFLLLVAHGIMNILIGMIVDNVMQKRTEMEKENAALEVQAKLAQLAKIKEIARSLDTDHDGQISLEELQKGMTIAAFRRMLRKVNVPTFLTAEELLAMLDHDGDGSLLLNEIVISFYRLIHSDTFQRDCLNQIGINRLKQIVVQQMEETNRGLKNLETLVFDLRRDVQGCVLGGTSVQSCHEGAQTSTKQEPAQDSPSSSCCDARPAQLPGPPHGVSSASQRPVKNRTDGDCHPKRCGVDMAQQTEVVLDARDVGKSSVSKGETDQGPITLQEVLACMQGFKSEVESRMHGCTAGVLATMAKAECLVGEQVNRSAESFVHSCAPGANLPFPRRSSL